MSQLFDFKKRFGKKVTLEEVRGNFVTKVNHSLIPLIDQEVGNYYTAREEISYGGHTYDSPGSRLFDYICINFGLEPRVIISNWNRNNYSSSTSTPSVKNLTCNDFEKTLLLVEIVYKYFKQGRHYRSEEYVNVIDEMVNTFILQPVSIGVFWRNGGFYPEGAVELDQAMIREPLDWLQDHPKIQKLYQNALDNYSQSIVQDIKRKDTCINAYQAVEEMAKSVVGEQKPFDSIFGSFANQLGLTSHWQKILNQYREFSKEYGRHPGSTDDFIPDISSTEAFLYLSGLLLRLAIQKLNKKQE